MVALQDGLEQSSCRSRFENVQLGLFRYITLGRLGHVP